MGNRALVFGSSPHDPYRRYTADTGTGGSACGKAKGCLRADPDDTRELLNYRKAFDLFPSTSGAVIQSRKGLIREIHKRLLKAFGEGLRPRVNTGKSKITWLTLALARRSIRRLRTRCAHHDGRTGRFSQQRSGYTPGVVSGIASSSWCTFIPFWTATVGHPGCSRPCICTGRDTTSSGFSRSANTTTGPEGLLPGHPGRPAMPAWT